MVSALSHDREKKRYSLIKPISIYQNSRIAVKVCSCCLLDSEYPLVFTSEQITQDFCLRDCNHSRNNRVKIIILSHCFCKYNLKQLLTSVWVARSWCLAPHFVAYYMYISTNSHLYFGEQFLNGVFIDLPVLISNSLRPKVDTIPRGIPINKKNKAQIIQDAMICFVIL